MPLKPVTTISHQPKKTVCNRDCPDACALVAQVENGQVTRLRGDKSHPITQGFLCPRTRRFVARQNSSERLMTPLIRKNGTLAPATFEDAIAFVAQRLHRIREESGASSICHYRSGGSLGALMGVTDRFWAAFGPVTTTHGDICSGAGNAAQKADFGAVDSNDLLDVEHAKHVVLWGKNLCTSSPHTLAVLKRAGAHMTGIDPVWSQTARSCQHFVQPRPGCDLALALAVGRLLLDAGLPSETTARTLDGLEGYRELCMRQSLPVLCDVADVQLEQVQMLAEIYQDGPVATLIGWGLGRHANGYATVRAIDALVAISGNLGISGGGASFSYSRKNAIRKADADMPPPPRTLCEPLLGSELRDALPRVRALWVTAGNPVAMLPDSDVTAAALENLDLLVVADAFLTDTAARADVVFAVPTLLEADDLVGSYGHHWLGVSQPVVAPPKEVRSDVQIVQALAAALDALESEHEPQRNKSSISKVVAGTAREWKQRLLKGDVELETLEKGPLRNPLTPQVAFEGGRFATANGRAQLLSTSPELNNKISNDGSEVDWPLVLFSVSTKEAQSSQWSVQRGGPAWVAVHSSVWPEGPARLRSQQGTLEVVVVHDQRQRGDLALIPKGGHLAKGRCANRLIKAALTDGGEGAALYDERVRLEPI